MAGVPCLVGTDSFTGWTPKLDATVVTRVLENGGIVTGKSVCENLSRGAVSITAATGPVQNPYAPGYNAGGSSSGTAALVASGAADMGLGCDQGGSIRIPAALCGLYGFKPTFGLVPYTGINSIDASLDFVGPITKSCMDCAILLQAIAGVDGLDDRQIAGSPMPADIPNYPDILKSTKADGVKGMKIGILKEALTDPPTQPGVEAKFRAAVAKFAELGATVTEVSVPLHGSSQTIYTVMSKMGNHLGMLGRATGRRQVMLTDMLELKNLPYTQGAIDKMSTFSKEALFAGEYGWKHYPHAYPKAVNLARKLKDQYDAALADVDFLVMPCTLCVAKKLPERNPMPLAYDDVGKGMVDNTCSFNASGHPALAMPIGFVPATDDESLKLPASLQIVGKFWDEANMLRAAYAWENAVNWKEF